MKLHVLTVDIYEAEVGDDYPVVVHQFLGRTREEALGYFEAHKKTDQFLMGCIEHGKWNGVECWTEQDWDTEEILDDEDDEFEDDDD